MDRERMHRMTDDLLDELGPVDFIIVEFPAGTLAMGPVRQRQ